MAKKPNTDPKKGAKPTTGVNQGTKPKQETVAAKEVKTPAQEEFLTGMDKKNFWHQKALHQWLIFLFAFLLYANAIPNKYSVDDSIVIQRNEFTKKGLKGMAGIWGEDTFVGFFGGKRNLVSGGRYRPFTVATFALENQLFGTVIKDAKGKPVKDKDGDIIYEGNPHISHAINGILFGILCWLIYLLLLKMFDQGISGRSKAVFIAFTAAVLFASHPLHTEAVANIKGRDEIMVTLCSLLATYWTMLSIGSARWILYLGGAVVSFFIALFSKESAIPFLVIIPAAIYFFQKEVDMPTIAVRTAPFFVAILIFWFGIRNPILHWDGKEAPLPELMNDPFMKMVSTGQNQRSYVAFTSSERYGLIFHTWLDYIKLLAFPHPLTNDYYPKHIGSEVIKGSKKLFGEVPASPPTDGSFFAKMTDEKGGTYYIKDSIPTLSTPYVMLSILLHLAMAGLTLMGLMKRKPYAFALLFYAATFSVVSNLFFPIGTTMAERFMFMPSVAFSMLCAMGLAQLASKNGAFSIRHLTMPLAIMGVVTLLYSIKTFDRNFDWMDDYTLFTTDIAVSPNSAKLNNAVSGVLQDKANSLANPVEKEPLLQKAINHSRNAVEIHPTYNGAWLLYGNANVLLGGIRFNQGDSLMRLARLPEQAQNSKVLSDQAAAKFNEALALYNEAVRDYLEVKRLKPDHPDLPINFTVVYRERGKLLGEKMGNVAEAIKNLEESNLWAKDKDVEVLRLLGVGYGVAGNHAKAIEHFEKSLKITPENAPVLFNLEVAYRQLAIITTNDPAKQAEYVKLADELQAKWKKVDPNYNPMGNK